MKTIAMWVLVVAGCSVGSVPPRTYDASAADDSDAPGAGIHDRLSDCPSWTRANVKPDFCERACEPMPAPTASYCAGATSPSGPGPVNCAVTSAIDGISGCCALVASPSRVLFFECPAATR